VERPKPPDTCCSSNLACGRGGEVRSFACLVGVYSGKARFQEEKVGAQRQLGHRGPIGLSVGDVRHIGDSLSSADGDQLTQLSEPSRSAIRQCD
jgi:hypothetical protein